MFHWGENCRANKYILKCLILWPCPLVIQMWCFWGGLSQRSFHYGGWTPIQVSSEKACCENKSKKTAAHLVSSPIKVESPLKQLGLGTLQNPSGAFSGFRWLPGLFFPYAPHKPTYHKTGTASIPESVGLCWSHTAYRSFCVSLSNVFPSCVLLPGM